jgi:hypothetical protein
VVKAFRFHYFGDGWGCLCVHMLDFFLTDLLLFILTGLLLSLSDDPSEIAKVIFSGVFTF